MERVNLDEFEGIERVNSTGKITTDGNHVVVGRKKGGDEILYENIETGNLETIGRSGEWVEA